jgi:hypothetical protein
MERDGLPRDPIDAAALVVRVVHQIDQRSHEQSETLLCDLLCAAWGSVTAQNQ